MGVARVLAHPLRQDEYALRHGSGRSARLRGAQAIVPQAHTGRVVRGRICIGRARTNRGAIRQVQTWCAEGPTAANLPGGRSSVTGGLSWRNQPANSHRRLKTGSYRGDPFKVGHVKARGDSAADLSSRSSAVDDSSYDVLRYSVYTTYIRFTGAFCALMILVEIWARGPLAPQTFVFVALTAVYGVLIFRTRYSRDTKVGTVFSIGIFMVAVSGFEMYLGGVSPIGLRAALLSAPIITVLLADIRPALAMYLWGIGHTVVFTPTDAGFRVHVLQAAGAIFVGGVLWLMAWKFDEARRKAECLADERELELRKALVEARAAVSARTSFLSNMSHEIRTPMNGVLGLSRLLLEDAEPSNRELAKTVVSSAESLLRILDDILDLSKLDAGALLVEPKATRPAEIAEQVVGLMGANASEAGLELRFEISDRVPAWVHLDGHRFRQVLSNLVGNAVKFTRKGSVDIELDYREGQLHCAVIDTGIGISREAIGTLFNPFQQADASTARRFGGTGLGLAICKRLCEIMGGEISASSVPGQGSTFRFRLPAASLVEPPASTPEDSVPLPPLTVLVAEDNAVNRLVVGRMLKNLGVTAKFVEDGEQAVASVAQSTYDLVLMDRHMPLVDGLEATRRIRSLPNRRAATPVVALTASVMADDRTECLDAGMNAFIPKPIEPKVLELTLRQYARVTD